jgi:hypothetical protein
MLSLSPRSGRRLMDARVVLPCRNLRRGRCGESTETCTRVSPKPSAGSSIVFSNVPDMHRSYRVAADKQEAAQVDWKQQAGMRPGFEYNWTGNNRQACYAPPSEAHPTSWVGNNRRRATVTDLRGGLGEEEDGPSVWMWTESASQIPWPRKARSSMSGRTTAGRNKKCLCSTLSVWPRGAARLSCATT